MFRAGSIFDQEWWYDAATDKNWHKVEYDDGKLVKASLVFTTYKDNGLKIVGMPAQARVMQPIIEFRPVETKHQLSALIKALSALGEQLPKFDQFRYTLPPDSELDLAFCLAGYEVGTGFTFRSTVCTSDDPWQKMDKRVRKNIRAGAKRMEVEIHRDIERYIRLSRKFIGARSFKDINDYDAMRRIWEACDQRNQALIASCVGKDGKDIAGAFILRDEAHLYHWLGCRDPDSSDYTANSLLTWRCIELAQTENLIFDMDGYANTNGGIFKSRFGLIPERRSVITRTTSRAALRCAISSQIRCIVGPTLRKGLLTIKNAVAKPKEDASLPRPSSKEANEIRNEPPLRA